MLDELPTDAVRESDALPVPLPVGRRVIEFPVLATSPFKNHLNSGVPFVIGRENAAAYKVFSGLLIVYWPETA